MKVIVSCLLLLILSVNYCKSQNNSDLYKIYGSVTDSTGSTPLPGTTIADKVSNKTTIANNQGNYEILLPAGTHNLSFSFVGYKSINVSLNVTSNQLININLPVETVRLKEVVIDSHLALITDNALPQMRLKKFGNNR